MRREIHFESYRQKLQRMTVVDPLATATAAAAGGGPTVATAGSQQPSTQSMAPSTVQHPSSVAGSNQVISRVTGLRNSWFLGSSSIIDCTIQIMKGFLGYSLDLRACILQGYRREPELAVGSEDEGGDPYVASPHQGHP